MTINEFKELLIQTPKIVSFAASTGPGLADRAESENYSGENVLMNYEHCLCSLCLSVSLSVSPSIYLCICIYMSLYIYVSVYIYTYICLQSIGA